MKIVTLDLELLQPGNEICEIGACTLDLNQKSITHQYQTHCNPGVPVTDYRLKNGQTITELTGITQAILDEAPPLREALEDFWSWFGQQQCGKRVATWGGGDVPFLVDQSRQQGVGCPRWVRQIDCKAIAILWRHATPGCKALGGLEAMLHLCGLQFQGLQHRALDDAINTARLLLHFYEHIRKGLLIENIVKGCKG